MGLKHRELTEAIIRCFFQVYNELGWGFLESVYKKALVIALNEAGLKTIPEQELTVSFHGLSVGTFRADIVVDEKIIVEVKVARTIDRAFEAQTINYLRASQLEVGLILNFGAKPEFKRVIYDLPDPCSSVKSVSSVSGAFGSVKEP